MFERRSFGMCVVFIALAAPAPAAEKQATPEGRQQKLIALVRSDAPPQEKAIACKQLAIYGGKEAVPALAPLLADEQLASWARIALEAIPDSAADDALRQAMGKLQGRLLVGVVNSIGVRRDAKAVEGLAARLADADAEVAAAAAVALGRIGGAPAAKALEASLARRVPTGCAAVRSAVAEGCILCAEKFLAEGNREEAVRLYDLVRQADVPKQRIVEATRGAILARQAAGVPLLVEQWRSADKALLAIGLRVARELPGREVTDALVAELGRAAPDRQALLLLVLADRGDSGALPAVLRAAKNAPSDVRAVAMRVLQRLGDASCVPVLLEAAMDADAQVSQTALAVLADLPGKEVDADLTARLPKAAGKARQVLIQLAGRRAIEAAVPALLKAAEDADGQVRSAALLALGSSIALGDLPVLIARVANPRTPEEAAAAQQALTAACTRMPDADACAEKLSAAMAQSAVPAKCRLLEVLSAMGGGKALQAVRAAAKDAEPELQDAASRLLGEWMSLDAAPVLLDLAKTAADAKYKTRALRGYIRLARQFSMPDEDRAGMCRVAMALAERDAEKKLVLEVLDRYPSLDTLKVAVEAAKVPALKSDATATAMTIVQKIGAESAEIRKMLAQVPYVPVKVEIIKAEYGAGKQVKDVTEALRQRVRDFPLIVLPSSDYNSSFGGDPASGIVKQLKIQYRLNGKAGEILLPENTTIVLPQPK
jgi:HEAT repeat protein